MTIAVVAEKPSVARDIARIVGARRHGTGRLDGDGYVVTWAIGHLVALAEPDVIRPEWKRWRREALPMIPGDWPLEVGARTRDQYEVVAAILRDSAVDEVVCATDAGREGELIFRYIYEASRSTKPVRRLWISSLTDDAIRAGLAHLRPAAEFDRLADAARGRSRADWLVGMNLSRAYTLAHAEARGEVLSVGRVQTPTLAMLVEREIAIRDFTSEDYREVVATFAVAASSQTSAASEAADRYDGVWFRPEPTAPARATASARDPDAAEARAEAEREARSRARRLPADGVEAEQIVARARTGVGRVAVVEARQRSLPPPLLYDLTELQRHANRLFGFSAQRSLELAQSLYERHKLISYPRTDSRHLSTDVAAEVAAVVAHVAARYPASAIAEGTGARPLGARHVDDARVSDHHAIVPTAVSAARVRLSADEERLYDLICRRLLMAWHADHLYSTTRVVTTISQPGVGGSNALHAADKAADQAVDHFESRGTRVDRVGWRVLDPPSTNAPTRTEADPDDSALPGLLRSDLPVAVVDARALARKTRPPRRFSEGTLLTAMESAGRSLDERALSDAMRECGLGTPATRAAIIETLLRRGYVERSGKALHATERGIGLIERVHPDVRSPVLTGRFEARLQAIERGDAALAPFMRDIEAWVREAVARVVGPETPAAQTDSPTPAAHADSPTPAAGIDPSAPARRVIPPAELPGLLSQRFGFASFRPHQQAVCEAALRGEDVLLVMPTGAGKSLCYQLPGLARAGTTLVVSPLIALMEDQVAKLRAIGLRAERIHSGRERTESRRVASAYVAGDLDYLFIAPERLSVPGFPELLARRTPALIAVDEAHCISQWGHDFRPDYRMLGQRLPALRPAPIIALTATATPRVQEDILAQLGIAGASKHIHGFRRSNIAIEIAEVAPAARDELTVDLLGRAGTTPAIVYAPTRKKAEALAAKLARRTPCAVYHAGLDSLRRDRVQSDFLGGRLQVIVATIAFGMGVDKADVRTVIHTALPASVEGYYQEIGRAGRDGAASRAILLHSYADRRTHEWFLERDYPDPEDLERVHAALDETARSADALAERIASRRRLGRERLEKALEKLWIHGGADVTPEGDATRGPSADWRSAYLEQRAHREAQLAEIARFAESSDCRMLRLVRHFGDQADGGKVCGLCDVCDPGSTRALRYREASLAEREAARQILKSLAERNGQSTGRLHADGFGASVERSDFEALLGALARAGLLRVEDDEFEAEGRRIAFRRAFATRRAGQLGPEAIGDLRIVVPAERPRRATARKPSAKKTSNPPGPARRRAPRSRDRKAPDRSASDAARNAGTAADASAIADALRAWRLAEARRRRVPAFRVLKDATLLAIADALPADEAALLAIPGIGPALARKHGADILGLIARDRSDP
jgi:DNA topoisomerase-3